MFDALSKAATWDPIGVAAEEPTSYTDRLKKDLVTIRAGVRAGRPNRTPAHTHTRWHCAG